MHLKPNCEVESLDVWRIDFMGPFTRSYGNKYILLDFCCVSMWMDSIALMNNETQSVTFFLKKFIMTPYTFISVDGSHSCHQVFGAMLES